MKKITFENGFYLILTILAVTGIVIKGNPLQIKPLAVVIIVYLILDLIVWLLRKLDEKILISKCDDCKNKLSKKSGFITINNKYAYCVDCYSKRLKYDMKMIMEADEGIHISESIQCPACGSYLLFTEFILYDGNSQCPKCKSSMDINELFIHNNIKNKIADNTPAYQKRVIEEKEQLDIKISKLDVFIGSDKFRELEIVEKTLLEIQIERMERYSNILSQRIKLFKNKTGE